MNFPLSRTPADPTALIEAVIDAHPTWVGDDLAGSLVVAGDVLHVPDWLDVDPEAVRRVIG